MAGVRLLLGPGQLLFEIRANEARPTLNNTVKDLDAGGMIFTTGYGFTF